MKIERIIISQSTADTGKEINNLFPLYIDYRDMQCKVKTQKRLSSLPATGTVHAHISSGAYAQINKRTNICKQQIPEEKMIDKIIFTKFKDIGCIAGKTKVFIRPFVLIVLKASES